MAFIVLVSGGKKNKMPDLVSLSLTDRAHVAPSNESQLDRGHLGSAARVGNEAKLALEGFGRMGGQWTDLL